MGHHYRRRRTSKDPLRDLIIDIFALVFTVILFFALWWVFSQPNAFKFSFGVTPTPIPATTSANTMPALEIFLILGIGAILVGGGGLAIWIIVWIVTQLFHYPYKVSSALPDRARQTTSSSVITPSTRVVQTQPVAPPTSSPQLTSQTVPDSQTSSNSPAPVAIPVPIAPTKPPIMERRGLLSRSDSDDLQENASPVEAKCLLTNLERGFFKTPYRAVVNRYFIFPQILLRELITADRRELPYELCGMWQGGIADFVLGDLKTLDAVAVIELDDPSHKLANAYPRDRRKNQFLNYVGIPLLRFPSKHLWNVATIQEEIEREVGSMQYGSSFLEQHECELFHALRKAREDDFIFPEVSLKQIIRRAGWLPLETSKTLQDESVDFVITHSKYLGTRIVVELDDASDRDSEKIDLFEQARIPRLVVNDAMADEAHLRQMIAQCLAN